MWLFAGESRWDLTLRVKTVKTQRKIMIWAAINEEGASAYAEVPAGTKINQDTYHVKQAILYNLYVK